MLSLQQVKGCADRSLTGWARYRAPPRVQLEQFSVVKSSTNLAVGGWLRAFNVAYLVGRALVTGSGLLRVVCEIVRKRVTAGYAARNNLSPIDKRRRCFLAA